MITYLRGTIAEKQPTRVVIDVGGVGYEVLIPLSSYDRLPATGETCTMLTHFHVREDLQQLFGFRSQEERAMFTQLLSITGIGPKLALSALSGLSVKDLRAAVVDGDAKRLNGIQGVGKKMAERMIVELRDTISASEALEATAGGDIDPAAAAHNLLADAMAALVALGYASDQARKMVEKALKGKQPPNRVPDIIKKALSGR